MLEKGAIPPDPRPFFSPPHAALVRVPPDPLRLLDRLAGLPGRVGLLTLAAPAAGLPWRSYLGALPVESSRAWAPTGGVTGPSVAGPWAHVPRWVGVVPYEAARSRLERPSWTPVERRASPHHAEPHWCRYAAMVVVDHRRGEVFVVGDDAASVQELRRAVERGRDGARGGEVTLLSTEAPAAHRARVEAALELIRAGDIYQVNLAHRIDVRLSGDGLPLLRRLSAASPSALAALLELPGSAALYSTTPELFLRASAGGEVATWPIKGTRRRGRDASEDEALRRELDADPKERAELSMVIDLERNDLGKLAETGSVRVPTEPWVVTLRTLHHRVARVAARLPRGVSWEQLLEATLPSGSVTGAPKVRAMEVIASLEAARRGLYTGALGHISRGGELVLAMAIRTLTVQDGVGHYPVGGGIVADSDPAREEEETRLKALQLTALLRGA